MGLNFLSRFLGMNFASSSKNLFGRSAGVTSRRYRMCSMQCYRWNRCSRYFKVLILCFPKWRRIQRKSRMINRCSCRSVINYRCGNRLVVLSLCSIGFNMGFIFRLPIFLISSRDKLLILLRSLRIGNSSY